MTEFLTASFAFVAGLVGVAASVLLYVVRGHFRGGTLGRGFGVWLFAVFLWALAMLQEGIMELFMESPYTELIHQVLMAVGLVIALLGTYIFYSIPSS